MRRSSPTRVALQHRVDATVSTPGTIAAYQNRIIQRDLYGSSAMSFAGVRPRMVGVGDQLHPIITAGAAPGFVAKGAAKDTQDATIGVFTTSPKRLMIGYRIARVDLFRVVGMESALRMDLGRSMSNGFDREVLRGNSTNGIDGFFDELAKLNIGGDAENFETAVGKLLRALDGELARALKDIKAIVNPVTARRLGTQFRGDSTMSVLELHRQGARWRLHLGERRRGNGASGRRGCIRRGRGNRADGAHGGRHRGR